MKVRSGALAEEMRMTMRRKMDRGREEVYQNRGLRKMIAKIASNGLISMVTETFLCLYLLFVSLTLLLASPL